MELQTVLKTKYPLTRILQQDKTRDCVTLTGLFDVGGYDEVGIIQYTLAGRVFFQHYLYIDEVYDD